MIPLFQVYISPDVDGPLSSVLHSGFIGQGAKVDEFEAQLADYLGNPYVVTVNSGTAALHLAYRLAGIDPGTEVVTTPMTCMATNEPLLERGARVVWADINSHTGNISPESVITKITPATRAIVAMHWGGTPAPLHMLLAIAHYNGIPLIEDCAQAFGAEYDGSRIGSLGLGGRFKCFSFQAIKILTTVDGGALVCQNEADYKRAKLLRWYGMDREDKTRLELRCEADVSEHGYKFHMNDVCATVGMANLASIPARLARVRENARWYDCELNRRWITRVRPTGWSAVHSSAYWLYTVLVDDPATFIPLMKARGVHTSPVHVRNDVHSCFAESRAPLPGVDAFVARQVSIPVGAWVSDEDRETIMNAIEEYDKQ